MTCIESREGQIEINAGVGVEGPGVGASRLPDVLLVPGPRVLEPDLHPHNQLGLDHLQPLQYLDHSLAQTRDVRDPLQVLTVGVTVNLKICLKNMNLLVSEGCPVPFGLSVLISVVFCVTLAGVSVSGGAVTSLHQLQIVTLTENLKLSIKFTLLLSQ